MVVGQNQRNFYFVSDLIGGFQRVTRSAAVRMAACKPTMPAVAKAVVIEAPVAPGVDAGHTASEVVWDQVADLLVGPSQGKPPHKDPDWTLANSSSNGGFCYNISTT